MPLVWRDLEVRALDLLPAALHDAVKADVVFEGVGADDVVIIRARQPYRDAAGLVDRAADRLEPHHDIEIPRRNGLVDRQRKAEIRPVLAELRDRLLPGGARIGHHPPVARRALAGTPEAEARRRGSGLHAGHVDLR